MEHHDVVIAGSGFSGIAMALELLRQGREDVVILERADDLGGTWRDNSYPGCACDIPSIVYSLAGEPNPGWTQAFAGQEEIWAYLRGVAERHGLPARMRFGCELLAATWDVADAVWRLETSTGPLTAGVLVSAVGALTDPAVPDLPGLDRFAGTAFHSARWDHGHDLRGRRVAVVGTGASAVQFVPEIRPDVQRLVVFQRTPPWVIGRLEVALGARWRRFLARVPVAGRLVRGAVCAALESRHALYRHPRLMAALNEGQGRRLLARQVADPELRARLTPAYRMGCKRLLLSNTWYPALTAGNVDVVTDGIREVVADGIVDDAGTHHRIDTIIFATGFRVTDQPIAQRVVGRDGRTLDDVWEGSPQAYYGTAVAGFPNFFMLLGPNTGLGHNSVLLMIESQLRYISAALAYRDRHGVAWIEPRAEAQAAYVAEVDAAMAGSVWTAGGCVSWYQDRTGRVSTLWPGTARSFGRRIGRFHPAEHRAGLPAASLEPAGALS